MINAPKRRDISKIYILIEKFLHKNQLLKTKNNINLYDHSCF